VIEKSVREKSMVYSNIQSIVTMNQNYFPYSRKLHLDATDKYVKPDAHVNNEEYGHELYNHQIKPILVLMRIFGIFPVEMLSGT
jgi:hypothetical protein